MSTTAITSAGKKGDIRIAFGFERPDTLSLPEKYDPAFASQAARWYDQPEPCVYLYTDWNKQVMVTIPVVYMHLFDYREKDRRGDPVALAKCREIAEMLYGMPTSYGAARVLDVITDWMTDIKNLPPPSVFRGDVEQMLQYMEKRGLEVVR